MCPDPVERVGRGTDRPLRPWCVASSLLLALFAAVYARPIWMGEVFYRRDIARYIHPIYAQLRARLWAGQWPLWNPYEYCGVPFLGDVTNAVFYPPNVAVLWASPATAITLLIITHHVLAALGLGLLLQRWGHAVPVALGAGLCFSLSGYAMAMDNSMTYLTGLCWAPWLLWSLDRLLERFSAARAGVLAAVYACLFTSGDLQWTYLAILLSGAYTLVCATSKLRALLWLGAAGGLALGLSGVQLLPLVSIARASNRWGGLPLAAAQAWSLHPVRALELLLAHPFGLLSEQTFWGQAFVDNPPHSTPWSNGLYLGAAVPVLALFAGRSLQARYLGGLTALCLLLALGSHTPVDGWFRAALPGWSAFRYPEKLMSVVTLGLCTAAGLGLGRLLQAPGAGLLQRRALMVFAAATLAALLITASTYAAAPVWLTGIDRVLLAAHGGAHHVARTAALELLRASGWRASICFTCAASLVWLSRRPDPAPNLLAWAWFALFALDLGTANARLVDSAPAELYRAPAIAAQRIRARLGAGAPQRIHGAALEFASSLPLQPDQQNAYYALWQRQTLAPKIGSEFGLRYVTGYSSTSSREFELFWNTLSHVPDDRALDLTAVGFILDSDRTPRYVDPQRFRLLASLPYLGLRVVELVKPTPLARVVYRTRRAESHERALSMLASASFAARTMAVVEQDIGPMDDAAHADPVQHVLETDEAETIVARLERRGLLVVAESYDPDWHVSLDGRPAPLLRVNYLQRGVVLEPGRHRVRFLYENRSWLYGAVLTGLSLALLLLIALRAARLRYRA